MNRPQLIFGRHPVMEALRAGNGMEKILLLQGVRSPEISEIKELAREAGVPVQNVPGQKLNSITMKNHQGVVAFMTLIQYYKVEDVMLKAYDEGRTPLFLLLDNITDVRNFGAIARSAEVAGVDALIVPQRGGALINEDAIKTSAGALNMIHVCKVRSLAEAVDYLKLNGIRVFAAQEKAGRKVFEVDFQVPASVILGAEGEGITKDLLQKADEVFSIPMTGKIGSFNVSVAAGIILYEALRQRVNIGNR